MAEDPRQGTLPLPLRAAADKVTPTALAPSPPPLSGLWPSPGLEQNTRMNANEAVAPSADAATRVIVYEQPLNERMRSFLRLDFLYQQAVHHHTRSDPWSTRAAVQALLEILAITLSNVGALFMQKLRDSEFLNAVKHRSTIPGGTCEFDLPDYTHWLNQPDEIRGADFAHWLAVIRPLGDAVSELLWMTREQGKSRPEVAPGGVFHLTLDRDVPAQMIRIALPVGTDIYPEISGSHYRCSVRFLVWQDASTRPIQTTEDVRFTLTTCT